MIVQSYIKGSSAVNIAASVETAASAGRIVAGEPLPTVRALAAVLRVSPATVAAAYRILRDRGVATADGRRGTRIRTAVGSSPAVRVEVAPNVRNLAEGNPDHALLPKLAPALRRAQVGQRLYGESLNDVELVRLTRRQFARDGVPAAHVAVVSGALDGIERVLREHLRPGDRVGVEDPCFTGILELLANLALEPVPIALDDEGLLPHAFNRALQRPLQAVIATPRAQNPTGAAFTRRRALALRHILRSDPAVLLIEDDHAGPVAGAAYITLVQKERSRWAVVRSTSKSLGPDLRVAVMAGDATTIARVEGRQHHGMRWVSHILQRLVATLWKDTSVKRQLRRAERTYAERRTALIAALQMHGIEAHGRTGLNVWIPLPEESAVVQALLHRGWAVNAGERYRIIAPPAIRVTVAALTPADAARFADDLAAILARRQRTAAA
jgi:DNA-binding transcriptional MocR family regulator